MLEAKKEAMKLFTSFWSLLRERLSSGDKMFGADCRI